ncbi:E3 ubiquitin-protein ligase Topors-like [Misgurnus anguillicaudatus]|uniref:E3 ubiquitin-protein ligase Topors-like n=1 Tax=Misgurnus anguillicaudatus TaxID=75329 RepID=UPI003CCFC0DA
MASPEIKDPPLKNSSSAALNNTIIKEASPESKCPICLDHFKNISYPNVCIHKFCFLCICKWSKNKAECPLCKQPFNSIYHSIKAENDYKRFDLRPTENGSFGNVAGQRFRYRTTLTGDHRPAPQRTSPPPDHGIIFESLSEPLPPRHNRDFHRMMRRLAARHRAESEGRSVRILREQEVVKFRRALYRRGLRVQSVQDGGRTRETSAEFFRKNPACLHRLVPWLRRELTVLYGMHGSFVNILQHIIMTLITRHNLDDQAVLHELRPFLLSHTEHFLHEFLSFAQSPFNVEAYDQHAVYDLPGPSTEDSSSETSVIAISEDESDSLMPGPQDFTTPRVSLSQTAWDDETPGPSYSLEPSQVFPFHVRNSDSESSVEETTVSVAAVTHQDHTSGSDEDCVIVGYLKPIAERTPELIQLTSDSEESDENGEPQSPRPPQHIRFTSESPSVTQRPSGRSPKDTTHVHTSNRHRQGDNHDKRHHEREGSSRSNRTHSGSHSRNHSLSKDGTHKRR